MTDAPLDVVTGAFSYTGGGIARALVRRGRRVRTLTNHPHRPGADPAIEVRPLTFEDAAGLASSLEGVDTLFNTYWIRFGARGESFDRTIANSATLFDAAREAGVRRVVHVSVTNPDIDSPFPYFRGKALVEEQLSRSVPSWAVVRPTVIFGPGDILMNNIAWLLRRFPVFAIPGDGRYRIRPVHVDDVGELCSDLAAEGSNTIADAVGPDTFTFEEMVGILRTVTGSTSRIVHVAPALARLAASAIGLAVRDTVITDHEIGGMMAEKAFSDGPTTGTRSFVEWARSNAVDLGKRYASEMRRHFS